MFLTTGFSHPENENLSLYTQIFKSLVLALRKIPLYPSGHRVIKAAISNPFELMTKYLEQASELTMGVKEEALLVEETSLETTETWLKNFISDLKKLNIQSITFSRGVTLDELERFLRILSISPDQIKSKGGLKTLLAKGEVTHVRFNEVLYEKITEGEKVAGVKDLEKTVGDKKGKVTGKDVVKAQETDLDETIAEYLSGRVNSLDIDCNLLAERIKADKQKIARLVWSKIPGRKTEKKVLDLLTRNFKAAGCSERETIKLTVGLIYNFPRRRASKARLEVAELKQTSERLAAENAKLKEKLAALEKELEQKIQVEAQLKQANRRLAREKQRIDAVIHNISDGLVVVDDQGKVLLMNPAAEKLLGTTQKERLGSHLVEAVKEEHLLALTKGMGLEEEEDVTEEIELVSSRDETRRIIQTSTAVVENKNGKTIGMVSVLHDVTKQKELDELKSKFVSLVSHELRTPLIAIEKNMSILLERVAGEINKDQEKFLSAAKRNVQRLGRLVNDLLDLSRIEAGKMELNFQSVELNKIIQDAVSSLKVWAEDKKIKLDMKLTPENPVLEADPDRLTQVLNNLVGNAIKFTPESGLVVIVSSLKKEVPGLRGEDFVQVDVTDTGIGLAEADKERIFNKFEQVSLISPAGIGGTGLGLPITKEIIQMHSGRIWVESSLGKGSTFSFALPLSRPG